jgi:sugar phosphate isomerase/epimerase
MSDVAIGVCLAAYADLEFETALAAAAATGASVVDLPTDSVFSVARTRPADPAVVSARFAEVGLGVACVSNTRDAQLLLGPHGPHTDAVLSGSVRAKVEHARASAMAAVELAAALGAPQVRLLLGCPDFGRWLRWRGSTVSWSDNVEAFVAEAVPLARQASEVGVELCIEPHVKHVPFDVASWLECREGVEAAGERLGLCFDPANLAALGFDPVDALAELDTVPSCVHVKDIERARTSRAPLGAGWVRYGPQPAVRFRAVPWGQLDWPAMLTALSELGYAGPLLVEHEDVLSDRHLGVPGAVRYLEANKLGSGAGEPWW